MQKNNGTVGNGEGSAVDEPALVAALRAGEFAAAALDVTSAEVMTQVHPASCWTLNAQHAERTAPNFVHTTTRFCVHETCACIHRTRRRRCAALPAHSVAPCVDPISKRFAAFPWGSHRLNRERFSLAQPLPPDSALWTLGDDQLLLSPHAANMTANYPEHSARLL